jgi:hypothetical protein
LILERGHPYRHGGVAFVIDFDAGAPYVLDGAAVEVIRQDLAGLEAVSVFEDDEQVEAEAGA